MPKKTTPKADLDNSKLNEKYFRALGRRKEAIAIAKLYPHKGSIIINQKPVAEFFKILEFQKIVEEPLKTIFKALESTVYKDGRIPDPDLKRWSNQGILLLNTSLTTRIHSSGDHIQLWKPFMSFLFQ